MAQMTTDKEFTEFVVLVRPQKAKPKRDEELQL